MESILDIALCLHETSHGISALVNIGVQLIGKLKNHTYGARPLHEMGWRVRRFLSMLRGRFPDVYVEEIKSDAITFRHDWGDVDQYDTKMAAQLSVQKWVRSLALSFPYTATL